MTRDKVIQLAFRTLLLCNTDEEKKQLLDQVYQAGKESTYNGDYKIKAVSDEGVVGQYNSIIEAANDCKMSSATVRNALRYYRKTREGIKFIYNK
jgi:hypothetical protein